jgi:hypothetical protein
MRVTVQIRIEGAESSPVTVPLHTIDHPCDQLQDADCLVRRTTRCQHFAGRVDSECAEKSPNANPACRQRCLTILRMAGGSSP